jgi:hypothetical protein
MAAQIETVIKEEQFDEIQNIEWVW